MNEILLPRLAELNGLPQFIKELYLSSQCNESIDPIWEGVAVFLNAGADHYLQTQQPRAYWYGLYEPTLNEGGLDGRIGIVTEFYGKGSVVCNSPWLRVSCHLPVFGSDDYEVCHFHSVSLDARLCTTVPMSFFSLAREQVVKPTPRLEDVRCSI